MIFFIVLLLFGTSPQTMYEGLDPTSISEHLAFYQLHQDKEIGKKALQDAWKLMAPEGQNIPFQFPATIDSFIQLIRPNDINKKAPLELSAEALTTIESIAKTLPNRKLKGYQITTAKAIDAIADVEIDLAHALLLLQTHSQDDQNKRRTFEAMLDVMALQILARTPMHASPEEKIREINQLIFHELGFRFPPHSNHEQAIDRYTFLSSVLESRRGVCLGVAILYLALGERLNLPLDIYTPPGHIFIGSNGTNVETTMRGVHIHLDEYLTINTKELKKRALKEVLGMAYFNEAAPLLGAGKWKEASERYLKAVHYMPDDLLAQELYGATLLLSGQEKEGKKWLEKAASKQNEELISQDTLAEDIVRGKVSQEALRAFFMTTDETRQSIEEKKKALSVALSNCPEFRGGLFQLASLSFELSKPQEAIAYLEKLHAVDGNDISCEYFLAALYHSRHHDVKALYHLECAKKIVAAAHCPTPKPLKELEVALLCAK